MTAPLLDCRAATLTVPGRTLCRELSFTVRPGECWVVIGPNGAGKTTLLHALAGGTLLVLADTLARTALAPAQLPVGVLTALTGVPLFLWLLRRSAA